MSEIEKLIDIVKILRAPDGCPWDKAQNLYSLKEQVAEECFELIDALDNKNIENIKEELGDILLHVVMHSEMANEEKLFSIEDVAKSINEKLIRRHPHVFNDEKIADADAVIKRWNEIKATEVKTDHKISVLDKAPKSIPSLIRATKMQKVAAKYGFDWTDIDDVIAKLDEEVLELKKVVAEKNKEEMLNEFGDILFAMVNVANHLDISPDEALRKTNRKFYNRFNYIETEVKKIGKDLKSCTLKEMEILWQEAKTKGL